MAIEQRLTDIARSDGELRQLLMWWWGMSPETSSKLLTYKKPTSGLDKGERRIIDLENTHGCLRGRCQSFTSIFRISRKGPPASFPAKVGNDTSQ